MAETALASAREKAAERGVDADFVAADARRLSALGGVFGTVLFHTFERSERRETWRAWRR